MKPIFISIMIAGIIAIGIFFGIRLFYQTQPQNDNQMKEMEIESDNKMTIVMQSISAPETEKTTPNTLMIYKTYYTQCMHYVQEYKEIDAALVNCTEEELKERCKGWRVDKFSSQEVELSREEEKFCNQHYQLKLENNVIVIYQVDSNGIETEYQQTGITTEYLTPEDILKLTTGIYVYGKENLTSTIEDYE